LNTSALRLPPLTSWPSIRCWIWGSVEVMGKFHLIDKTSF
jgi:hypothetical protein